MLILLTFISTIVALASSQSSTVIASTSTSPARIEIWQDLSAIPMDVIAELSRVCIVASRQEYTLDTSRSYTYISYPSSYRATLTQGIDVVDRAFRTAEMSFSRVQMIIGQVSSELSTALTVLFDGTIQDRQMLLPSTLKNIQRMGTGATSVIEKVSAELEQAAAFFDELLRAVQPSSPSSTTSASVGSTSTQTNKSPLDIDHATAVSNILAQFKSSIAVWNQLAQQSKKLAIQTSAAAQVMNDRNALLWILGDIDEAANLLSTLASLYTPISMKIITPHSIKIATYLSLEREEERFAAVQKVNERVDHNIPLVQQYFAQAMVDHEVHNTERNEQYNRLATTPSA